VSETQPPISAAYQNHLLEHYSSGIVDDLVDWRYAALPSQPGQAIAYARLNEGASERPVIYVPGFSEGIVAKAPFAADLADRGFDVILPDQNRRGLLVDSVTGRKGATYSQAVNMMAILDAEAVGQVDVVTHSYGSLIFDQMVEQARAAGKPYFEGSRMVLLAPAGFNRQETLPRLTRRFGRAVINEGKTAKDFDEGSEMLKAGIRNAFANVPRTLREILELSRRHVDYERLAKLGEVSVVSYAEDDVYPYQVIEKEMVRAIEFGVSWSTPVACAIDGRAHRSGRDASHNDEQFNPGRVAPAVAQLLEAA